MEDRAVALVTGASSGIGEATARNPHPALRNKVTRQTRQVALLKRFAPAAAFEAGIRRSFKQHISDTALRAFTERLRRA